MAGPVLPIHQPQLARHNGGNEAELIHPQESEKVALFYCNPLKDYRIYSSAYRTAINMAVSTVGGCNALSGDSETKTKLARLTSIIAGVGGGLRICDTYGQWKKKPMYCFKSALLAPIDVAIVVLFIYASAKTGDDKEKQKSAETLGY